MSKENIGSYEVKTRLSEILRRVQAGESFTITNRGKPVADLMPSKVASRQKTAAAIDAIRKTRKTVASISDKRLEKYRKEGRK